MIQIIGQKGVKAGSSDARWRFVAATRTENSVSLLTVAETAQQELTWRDQNSGTFAMVVLGTPTSAKAGHLRPTSFTRLDG